MDRYFFVLGFLLLGSGCEDPNKKNWGGDTPMHNAVWGDKVHELEKLHKKGGDLNVKGAWDRTLLHKSAEYFGGPKCAEYLLKHGADVDPRDREGATPLHYAATHGSEDVAVLLIEHQADVNARDNNEKTPLHWAVDKAHRTFIVDLLIQHGADVHAADTRGETPLHRAAVHNSNLEILKALLDNGADINVKDNLGNTPLLLALASPFFCPMSEETLPREQRMEQWRDRMKLYDNFGHSGFAFPRPYINLRVIEFLVEHGADLRAVNHAGKTVLDIAIKECLDPYVFKYLSEQEASFDAKYPLPHLD